MYVNLKYKKGNEHLHSYFATWREDEWMMVELCRFSTHKGDADFKVLLESFSRCYSGSRAIYIEGIEFRAIDNATKDVLYTTSIVKLSDLKQPLHLRSTDMIELLPQQVFRIKCKIEYQSLSPCTDYVCYLVFKLSKDCQGLHCPVKVRDILRWKNKETKILYFRSPKPLDRHDADWVPEQREDGFMEVIVWKFNSKGDLRNNYIPMNVKLIAFEGTMSGLTAFRLEVRPFVMF
ncbi:hypothetical protein OSB04_001022 [Centaurea solstitialis]|uniref:Phloem protein 2-like protein n=1 Tax=Centaurea solstitialis TaxID=347529 RepID=A0AA38WUS6_9ASTR|nr:hypothetical protein OSB04_001022 [Centaurea solstitialis]